MLFLSAFGGERRRERAERQRGRSATLLCGDTAPDPDTAPPAPRDCPLATVPGQPVEQRQRRLNLRAWVGRPRPIARVAQRAWTTSRQATTHLGLAFRHSQSSL